MEKKLNTRVKVLQIYAVILTMAFIIFYVIIMNKMDHLNRFKEISVERINVVERDGKLKMVISNHESQHPGSFDGKIMSKRDRPAGIIFFNDDGDECGGLIYDGNKSGAGMVFSVDQYKNDQVLQLQYSQEPALDQKTTKTYGLKIWDRPDSFTLGNLIHLDDSLKKLNDTGIYNREFQHLQAKGLLGHERLFVGKTRMDETGLFIRDKNGLPRIKIYIDPNNNPVLQALDDKGNVVGFNNK